MGCEVFYRDVDRVWKLDLTLEELEFLSKRWKEDLTQPTIDKPLHTRKERRDASS